GIDELELVLLAEQHPKLPPLAFQKFTRYARAFRGAHLVPVPVLAAEPRLKKILSRLPAVRRREEDQLTAARCRRPHRTQRDEHLLFHVCCFVDDYQLWCAVASDCSGITRQAHDAAAVCQRARAFIIFLKDFSRLQIL